MYKMGLIFMKLACNEGSHEQVAMFEFGPDQTITPVLLTVEQWNLPLHGKFAPADCF